LDDHVNLLIVGLMADDAQQQFIKLVRTPGLRPGDPPGLTTGSARPGRDSIRRSGDSGEGQKMAGAKAAKLPQETQENKANRALPLIPYRESFL
jgi:hypothetical protein